jgi:surface antigen
MNINDFVQKYSGKIVADPWGTYKGECVSLVKMWLQENGWPMLRGNAINWQYNGGSAYRWIKNYAWTVPQPGDIAVFQVGVYGHIGIVVSANVRTMDVFNQNWPTGNDTDPARITRFNYTSPKCLGFLRKV